MSLARLASGPSESDIRAFQCGGCRHVQVATVEADPMKSDAIRWLAGYDLKSPN
jgi:hypothetical protein